MVYDGYNLKTRIFSLIISVVICCLSFSGCIVKTVDSKLDSDSTSVKAIETTTTETTELTEITTSVADTEPVVPIGIYNQVTSKTGKLEEYELIDGKYLDDMSRGRDLNCFAVFPSIEKTVSDDYFQYIWKNCLEKNPEMANFKIGYYLEYKTSDGNAVSNLIKRPSDIRSDYWDYLEVYIYDDVNQEIKQWHSHLLENEITDKTVVTSIKLTAGSKIKSVNDIKLTAFLYSSDADFDPKTGMFIGRNSYTISVEANSTR